MQPRLTLRSTGRATAFVARASFHCGPGAARCRTPVSFTLGVTNPTFRRSVKFLSLPSSDHPLVCLRSLREADVEPWSQYLNLPEVYQHTSWNHPTSQELSSYLGNEIDNEPSALLRLAIADRETDQLVGTIGFHTVSEQNRSAELAYDLHPSMWHKGVATAIATVVVAWAHNETSTVRVQATVLQSNASSIRVLERVGFLREGLLRSYRVVRGKPGNFYMYAHFAPTPSDA